MTLTYLRHNVSHEVVDGLFGVSTATSENTFHEVAPLTRSPKGSELTPAQREANRQLAQQRIYVEHGIRRVKGGAFFGTITGWPSVYLRRSHMRSWAWCNGDGSWGKPETTQKRPA